MNKDKFDMFVEIQKSGLTNMANIKQVISLSNDVLNREDCYEIMKNYDKYEEQYKGD